MNKRIYRLLNIVLAAALILNSVAVFAADSADTGTVCDLINDKLETSDAVYEMSGFTLRNDMSARCGYGTARGIFMTSSGNAYMTFYAGNRESFTSAEFKVTSNSTKSWIINQAAYLNEMVKVSEDGETWTSVSGGSAEKLGTVTDNVGTWDTYKLNWNFGSKVKYVKITSRVKSDDFDAYNLFIHNARLEGEAESVLLVDDGIYDLSKVRVLKGFGNSSAWSNCGSVSRTVFYRKGSGDAYALYDVKELGDVNEAEIEITVSNTNSWKITDSGQLDDIIYMSHDGEEYTAAAELSGYSAAKKLKSTQNNHNTFTLSYTFASGYEYIKIKADKFGEWQMYLTGVKLYGKKSATAPEEPEGYEDGYLALGDAFENRRIEKPCDSAGFEINRAVNAKTGDKVSPKAVAVKTSKADAAGYLVYEADEGGGFDYVEAKITVEGPNNAWRLTELGAVGDIFLVSDNGTDFSKAAELKVKHTATNTDGAQQFANYTVYGKLPKGTAYFKIDAQPFADWLFLVREVMLYSDYGTSRLLLNSDISAPDEKVEVSGFKLDSAESTHCGYTESRNVYVSQTNDAYMIFDAGKGNKGTAAKVTLTYNVIKQWMVEQDNYRNGGLVQASEDGETWTNVSGVTYSTPTAVTDGSGSVFKTTTLCFDVPECRFVRINGYVYGDVFGAWNFMIHGVKLYGKDDFDYRTAPSLAKVHEDYFRIAVAIEPSEMYDYNELLLSEFNEVTVENQLKPSVVHPTESAYEFEGTDRIVEFAEANGLKVRGHGLFYEKVMPTWFFEDDGSGTPLKEQFLTRLESHIKTVVGRYKGRIYAYDVANELFGHNGYDISNLRSKLKMTDSEIGECIKSAFVWAHEADPDAILILNDNYYDIVQKREDIYTKVKTWVEEGTPIHGIGFQDHLFIDTRADAVDETLTLFESISPDFKLFITELDVSAYGVLDSTSAYPDFMAEEIKEISARKYAALFDVYRKHASRIETVGTWNICDAVCWYETNPAKRYYATMFDYDGKPNPSFYAALDTDGALPRSEGTTPPVVKNNNYTIDFGNDTLILRGEYSGNVTAKLIGCFGTEKELESKAITAYGDYELVFDIDKENVYDGQTSPDYILEVSEGGTVKRDEFTYYKKGQENGMYTITDDFGDYSKVYGEKNTMLTENGVSYKKIWGSGVFGDGELVYKIPAGRVPESIEAKMYSKNTGGLYKLYVSADNVTYKALDADWNKDGTASRNYTLTAAKEKFTNDIKYIKIVLPVNAESNSRMSSFKLYTSDAGFEFETEPVLSRTGSTWSASGSYVNSLYKESGEQVILAVYDSEGRLVGTDSESYGYGKNLKDFDLTVSAETDGLSTDSYKARLYIWETGKLIPIYSINE